MLFRKIYILLLISIGSLLFAQGKVYLVLGSDTGIWNGLDTRKHFHNYGLELYTDPEANAHKVMDFDFRNEMQDSYGTPLKMTWWMMSGNTFRYSINKNVPNPNSMTFYLMEKYHGDKIRLLGDEISLHYHTFTWTDYDNDGVYWWNQALSYEEFSEDFEYTLAQNLIDENVFPVSYRSGWHYMDNKWQKYLENILPFSMHNDYPVKGTDATEPLDNIYDWSMAPMEFVPYHPSEYNYQIPGNMKGYELRSIYMSRVTQDFMDAIFMKALQGVDQVVCIWAHLPEADFLDNIQKVHQIAAKSDASFSTVDFKYATGIEAMQQWLKTDDTVSPQINISEEASGDNIYFTIQVDEPIFQDFPFVAVKDKYLRYERLPLTEISNGIWKTTKPINKEIAAKVGIAVTDLVGNLSTKSINYLPNDLFVDNSEIEYEEIYGQWNTSENKAWYINSRTIEIPINDSAIAKWKLNVTEDLLYNIFYQIPEVANPVDSIEFIVESNGSEIFKKNFNKPINEKDWIYIGTVPLKNSENYLIVKGINKSNSVKNFSSDVVKISALVKDREIVPEVEAVDFSFVAQGDTVLFDFVIHNYGIENLKIDQISALNSFTKINEEFPINIGGMSDKIISIAFLSMQLGPKQDTVFIYSDDFINPIYKIPVTANVVPPFKIIDNANTQDYQEFGEWNTSVTQAYGSNSRFSYINQSPRASAKFMTELTYSGNYDVEIIVPKSENSTDNALYNLRINGETVDSIVINQNEGSGNWRVLFNNYLPNKTPIELQVIDHGNSNAGPVLRTDAVKFQLKTAITNIDENRNELILEKFALAQNYPNPFNPSTSIEYSVMSNEYVSLKIYDILGNEIATLVNEQKSPGKYLVNFNVGNLTSGIYFYKMTAGNFTEVRKMILLK